MRHTSSAPRTPTLGSRADEQPPPTRDPPPLHRQPRRGRRAHRPHRRRPRHHARLRRLRGRRRRAPTPAAARPSCSGRPAPRRATSTRSASCRPPSRLAAPPRIRAGAPQREPALREPLRAARRHVRRPPAGVMERMARKLPAKRAMAEAGLRVIPGSPGLVESVEHAREIADEVGYPVLLKANSGGGGRGMRVAETPDDVARPSRTPPARPRPPSGTRGSTSRSSSAADATWRFRSSRTSYGNVAPPRGARLHGPAQPPEAHRGVALPCASRTEERAPHPRRGGLRRPADLAYVGAGTIEMLLDERGRRSASWR